MNVRWSQQVSIAPVPDIDLGTSFSFGSDDGEEAEIQSNERPSMHSKSNSFRLVIKKDSKIEEMVTDSSKPTPFDRRSRSTPLTQREKQTTSKLNSKVQTPIQMDKKTTKRVEKDRKEDLGMIKDAFFSNSWRAKNVEKKDFLSSKTPTSSPVGIGIDMMIAEESNSRDDESEQESVLSSVFGSLFKAVDPTMRDGAPQKKSVPFKLQMLTSSAAEECTLSKKELRQLFITTSEATVEGKWHIVMKNLLENKSILGFQCSKHEMKNIIHVLASQKEIPDEVVEVMICHGAAGICQADLHGCVPLHYAASVGRDVNCVKALVTAWPFGASSRNIDGDLPLHVAVWAGQG